MLRKLRHREEANVSKSRYLLVIQSDCVRKNRNCCWWPARWSLYLEKKVRKKLTSLSCDWLKKAVSQTYTNSRSSAGLWRKSLYKKTFTCFRLGTSAPLPRVSQHVAVPCSGMARWGYRSLRLCTRRTHIVYDTWNQVAIRPPLLCRHGRHPRLHDPGSCGGPEQHPGPNTVLLIPERLSVLLCVFHTDQWPTCQHHLGGSLKYRKEKKFTQQDPTCDRWHWNMCWGRPRPGAQGGGCCAHTCGGLGAGPQARGSAVIIALLAPAPNSG